MSVIQVLSATTHKLRIVVDANATTNESRCTVNYSKQTATVAHTGLTAVLSATTGTTAVDLIGPPGASEEWSIVNIAIWNRDTVDHTYTIYLDVSGTQYNLYTAQSVKAGKSTILAVGGSSGGSSGGSLVTPASSTNLAIVTWSGTAADTLLNNANATISSGVISSTAKEVTGTGGNGFLGIVAQSSDAAAPAATGLRLEANASGYLAWLVKNGSDTYRRALIGALTANRDYTLPDVAGTISLNEELPRGNLVKNPSFDVWENGVSAVPDAYTLTGAGASVAQEATIVKVGAYSAKLTRAGTDCYITQDVYSAHGSTFVRSGVYTFGAWVYATVASRARLRVDDGVTVTNSSYHTGGSAWEWLTVTVTVGAAITTLKVGLQVNTGDTSAYIDGLMLVQASNLASGYYPDTRPFNDFPVRAWLVHRQALVTAGNALRTDVGTSDIGNAVTYQNTAANGDTFTQSVFLRAGTYTFSALGLTGTSEGIIDWYIDNVSFITGQDWYSSPAVHNVIKTGSCTVIGDGFHVLKGVINGKNASSSSYYRTLQECWFTPSAD